MSTFSFLVELLLVYLFATLEGNHKIKKKKNEKEKLHYIKLIIIRKKKNYLFSVWEEKL